MAKAELEYCWFFNHPVGGWCGGTDDSEWVASKAIVERNAAFCEWETKIVSREPPAQRKVLPGSVRPSIRKN